MTEQTRILVVEDEVIIAMDLRARLTDLGYAVADMAVSGEEAITRAAALRPDLVLMDIVLKGELDGIAAAEQIRTSLHIPVIYLTAHSDEQTLQRARITQPYGYLLKPFDDRELYTGIELAIYKHRMEQKLKESEQWLATTLRSIGDAVIATDAEGRIKFMNPVAEALTGWQQADAVGLGANVVFNIIDQHTREAAESPITKALREGVTTTLANHTVLITKGGTEVPIDDSAAPIRQDDGNIIGVVLVFRDITERLRALEKLARKARELACSNADLERFAYAASHDLREPLRMVASFVQLLGERYRGQLDADADDFIGYAVGGAQRMERLINDLLEYSRIGSRGEPFRPTDVTIAVEEALWNLNLAIEDAGATVTCDPLPTVMADSTQLTQLFQNLIDNAVKFRDAQPPQVHISARPISPEMESGSRGEWELGRTGDHLSHSPTPPLPDSPALPLSPSWLFSVCDNGIGIDPKDYARIFGIFQRLHRREEYPGTGIGLAICQRIVERHDGCIWVESEVGQGTCFYFTLPSP